MKSTDAWIVRPVSVRTSSCTSGHPESNASCSVLPSTVERSKICTPASPDACSFDLEEALRRFGDQHRPSIAGEQQDAVLEIAQNLVEIVLQRGEDLFHIAHALPDLLDLGGNPLRRVLLDAAAASASVVPAPEVQ